MTIHTPALAASPELPVAGQHAIAEHRDLHLALTEHPDLDPAVFRTLYTAGTRYEVARALVSRPLDDDLVRHVLVSARERRPEIVGALACVTAPAAADLRETILGIDDPSVADGVLDNRDWTPDEQARVAARAPGDTLIGWLATLDPARDTRLVEASLAGWYDRNHDTTQRLHHDDLGTVLRAAVRWPQLLDAPTEHVGPSLRSVIGSLSRDSRTLHGLLDQAETLAGRGWTMGATAVVEAVALNPHASLRVQRRAKRLARTRIECHYLTGFTPGISAGPGDGPMDELRAGRFLNVLERNTHARHRTVWSAVQLAYTADQLTPRATDRLVDHLVEHGRAAGLDRDTATQALARHHVNPATHAEMMRRLWPSSYAPRPATLSIDGLLACLDTEGGYEQTQADADVRRLTARLGDDREAWSLAIVLLRDGWDRDLDELALVISQLTTPTREAVA